MADKTVVVRLVVRSGDFTSGMARAAGATTAFAAQAEQGAKRAANSTKSLGLASAAAGKMILLGIGGAMAVSAKAAIDFESSLAGVAKTTNLAGPALEGFGDAIRNLALTELPTDVNQLNRIAELGGQLGIQTRNLVGFTKTIANLGETTNLSFEEGATGLARFANIMGTSQGDFDRLGSTIVELGNNFATTESEILTFALRIAPTGAVIGATEAQVLGLATALSSVGVPAERGGTAIQRVFIQMKQAVDKGNESINGFADIAGVATEEFNAMFDRNPAEAFSAFVGGLDQISKSGGDVFKALDQVNLAEQRTIQALLAAANATDLVEQAVSDAELAFKQNVALQEEAALRYGTTASQLKFLGNAFNDLKIEAGSAILGSGGLQFGVEVLREMFGIINDNLGNVGQFARIFGVLATLKLGQGIGGFLGGIGPNLKKMNNARKGLEGIHGAARVAKIAVGGLNIAMNAAGIVAGVVAGIWAMQAIKAAELRAQVRQLNEEIKEGADPVEAFVGAMSQEGGFLTPENVEILNALGLGVNDLAEAALLGKNPIKDLMEGGDIELGVAGNMITDLERASIAIEEAGLGTADAFGRDPTTGEWKRGMSSGAATLRGLSEDYDVLLEQAEALNEMRTDEVVNSIISLQQHVGKTPEQLQNMAQEIMDLFGFDVSEGEIESFFAPYEDAAMRMKESLAPNFKEVEKNFLQMIGSTEEGQDALEKFYDDVGAASQTFADTIESDFQAINDSVMSGVPAWSEYSSKVETKLSDAKKWMRDYVEDVASWAGIQEVVVENASNATIGYLDSLPVNVRAALSKLSDAELITYIEELNGQFDSLSASVGEIFQTRLPRLIENASPELAAALTTAHETIITNFGANGTQEAEAWNLAVADVLGDFPPETRELLQAELQELLGPELWAEMKSAAAAGGDAVSQGFADGLSTIADRAQEQIDRAREAVVSRFTTPDSAHGWGVGSPSKLTEKYGKFVGEGFGLGLEKSLMGVDKLLSPRAVAPQTISTPAPTVNLNTEGGDRSIHMHYSGGGGVPEHELHKASLTLSRLVNLLEVPKGI